LLSHWPGWAEALAGMNEEERATAVALRDRFAEFGNDDPENAALSEILENIPQLARFLALRDIWPRYIDRWAEPGTLENVPAAARLLAAGADRDDLVRIARSAAYDTAFGLLYTLSSYGGHGDMVTAIRPTTLQDGR
jgi:hypothetical protein